MTTWKQLSRPLRVAIAAPWLLLLALVSTASIPAFRALLLDAANHPTADVDLTSTHWTGTLDPARLPARVPLLDQYGDLTISDAATVVAGGFQSGSGGYSASGYQVIDPSRNATFANLSFDLGQSGSDGSGSLSLGNSLFVGVGIATVGATINVGGLVVADANSIIVTSPNGFEYRLVVSDDGTTLSTASYP